MLTDHVPRLQTQAAVHGIKQDIARGPRRILAQALFEPFIELQR
jgi:hypothetical protein